MIDKGHGEFAFFYKLYLFLWRLNPFGPFAIVEKKLLHQSEAVFLKGGVDFIFKNLAVEMIGDRAFVSGCLYAAKIERTKSQKSYTSRYSLGEGFLE